jgi:hypothetical protein
MRTAREDLLRLVARLPAPWGGPPGCSDRSDRLDVISEMPNTDDASRCLPHAATALEALARAVEGDLRQTISALRRVLVLPDMPPERRRQLQQTLADLEDALARLQERPGPASERLEQAPGPPDL